MSKRAVASSFLLLTSQPELDHLCLGLAELPGHTVLIGFLPNSLLSNYFFHKFNELRFDPVSGRHFFLSFLSVDKDFNTPLLLSLKVNVDVVFDVFKSKKKKL